MNGRGRSVLGEQGIYVWDGNYYALAVTERLGLEGNGGMVRIGAVHYNTVEEIKRLGDALRTMASQRCTGILYLVSGCSGSLLIVG